MARYTVELRKVVESTNIFDFHYDFYEPNKKAEFEDDFIKHFYFREIGCETVDRFKWFLNDKMQTVFPYYNKLFEAATKEYSILENYYMVEESTTERDNKGKTFGVASTVGRTQDDQSATGSEKRDTAGTSTGNVTGENTGTSSDSTTSNTTSSGSQTTETNSQGTTSSERSETVSGQTSASQNVEGTKNKTTTDTETSEQEDKKRFLDTPQGAVDLANINYLTTLNQDTSNKETSRNGTEKETDSQTTTGSGTETRNTNGETSETTTGNSSGNTTNESESTTTGSSSGTTKENSSVDQSTTTSENVSAESSNTYKAEQKTTSDNNTRSYSEGEAQEKTRLTRHGNIGVMSDADMMQKHIELQKILSKIEKMFFDECEDLFMLVY